MRERCAETFCARKIQRAPKRKKSRVGPDLPVKDYDEQLLSSRFVRHFFLEQKLAQPAGPGSSELVLTERGRKLLELLADAIGRDKGKW